MEFPSENVLRETEVSKMVFSTSQGFLVSVNTGGPKTFNRVPSSIFWLSSLMTHLNVTCPFG